MMMSHKKAVPKNVQAEADEARKRREFQLAYLKLCAEHGLIHVAHGQIQPVEGAVFRVVGVWGIEEYKPQK
jgi:hypothetical protein